MSKGLRIGLSGLGVGLDHGLRLEKKQRGIITAVYDPDVAKVEAALGRVALAHRVRIHKSCADLVSDPDIDVVVIGSPNDLHAGQVELAAAAGKAIFLEKPLGADLNQARRIVEAVRKNACLCQVGLVYRYSPFFRKLMDLLHGGIIGDIQMMYCQEFVDWVWQPEWRNSQSRSGGALVEKNCHHFDIFNWALKDKVEAERVSAFGGRSHYRDREIIDNATVNIEYANGVRANLMLCLFSKYTGLEFGFIGSEGKVLCHMDGCERPRRDTITFYPKSHLCKDSTVYYVDYELEFDDCKINPDAIHASSWGHSGNVREVEEFADCVEQGKEPFCNVETGLRSLYIPLAAERSIIENRIISIRELHES